MSSPTEMLEAEHRVIALIVGAAPVLISKIDEGGPVDNSLLTGIVEFMRLYADKCHHGKEEELLFPLLAEKGVPMHGCPIGGLINEHARGRVLVKGLDEAASALSINEADDVARGRLITNLRGIADLYPGHIWREDYMLFPMTDKILGKEEQDTLYAAFQKVDEGIGSQVIERLVRFAKSI
ncbi:MAG: hemerythrin domain-containing protein [Chlorobiales bacterium]|nr:hemerythrin domain-containing protein [Chlorobiales bacterium]